MLRGETFRVCPRDLTLSGKDNVFPYTFCGLKNTFLCHTGNDCEETGYGSVSESADCHPVVTQKR